MTKGYVALALPIDLSTLGTLELCYLWNDATDPASLRSEDEHLAACDDARRLNTILQTRYGWIESDHSGRRYVTSGS